MSETKVAHMPWIRIEIDSEIYLQPEELHNRLMLAFEVTLHHRIEIHQSYFSDILVSILVTLTNL